MLSHRHECTSTWFSSITINGTDQGQVNANNYVNNILEHIEIESLQNWANQSESFRIIRSLVASENVTLMTTKLQMTPEGALASHRINNVAHRNPRIISNKNQYNMHITSNLPMDGRCNYQLISKEITWKNWYDKYVSQWTVEVQDIPQYTSCLEEVEKCFLGWDRFGVRSIYLVLPLCTLISIS